MQEKKIRKRGALRQMTLTAFFAALIAVCSQIAIPMAVPFTMQTFAVFLALLMLGGTDGLVSIVLYILLGAAGLPVFSGFSGGIGRLTGPTGGFIVGFMLTALCYIVATRLFGKSRFVRIAALIIGHFLLCYAAGVIWFSYNAGTSSGKALAVCVLPFILPDLLKLALALLISSRLSSLTSSRNS